jgi:prepilin-type N-terminal cleavage/methylation domain-containing protein/prepilin-type processing-associated H-X9-DG protein
MSVRNRRVPHVGFTLIELLVVIAIIAILAAILFPVFAQARAQARKINGLSIVKQVDLAVLMYTEDFDETWPRSGYHCQVYSDGYENACGITNWSNVVAPYHKNAQIVQDPADYTLDGGVIPYPNGRHSVLLNDNLSHTPCPIPGDPYGRYTWQTGDYGCVGEDREVGNSEAIVNSPSDCVLIAEGNDGIDSLGPMEGIGDADWTGNTGPSKWKEENNLGQWTTMHVTATNYAGWTNITGTPIFGEGTNFAFVDGHAKYVRVYDSAQSNSSTYGLIIHATLPWRKNIDPFQHGINAPITLGLFQGSYTDPDYQADNWR